MLLPLFAFTVASLLTFLLYLIALLAIWLFGRYVITALKAPSFVMIVFNVIMAFAALLVFLNYLGFI